MNRKEMRELPQAGTNGCSRREYEKVNDSKINNDDDNSMSLEEEAVNIRPTSTCPIIFC